MNWVDFVIEQARSSNCTKANDAAGLADRKLTNFGQDVSMNSFYVLPSNPMSASGWEDLFKWKASGKDTFVEVDVLGPKSKVAAVATPDTAYAFRPALLAVQFGTAWRNEKKNDRMNLALSSAGTVGIELDRRALIASSRHRVIASSRALALSLALRSFARSSRRSTSRRPSFRARSTTWPCKARICSATTGRTFPG